jgi:cytochrome oxidase Cu insertion factor (SCO1/SenC/PrrC family)
VRTGFPWVLVLLCAIPCSGCTQPTPEPVAPATVPGLEFQPPDPGTYDLPAIQDAVDGAVMDVDGSVRRLFDYLGDRHVLLSFVYTRCADATGCPLARATLQMVQAELSHRPQLAREVRLITLSVDPERDTPDAMRTYAARDHQDMPWEAQPWVFLTTRSQEDLQPILDGYGQYLVP